jgi:hypothetical protein
MMEDPAFEIMFRVVLFVLLSSAGIALIVGTLRGFRLFKYPPPDYKSNLPYKVLGLLGKKALYYYQIFLGSLFFLLSIIALYDLIALIFSN